MKKLIIFITLAIIGSNYLVAMEKSTETTKKEEEQIEQEFSFLKVLPRDLQIEIIGYLTESENLDEAIKNIKALAVTHSLFDNLINDLSVMNMILTKLSENFKKDPIYIASLMQTKGSINWLVKKADKKEVESFLKNKVFDIKYGRAFSSLHKPKFIEKLLNADFTFSDSLKAKMINYYDYGIKYISMFLEELNLSSSLKSNALIKIAKRLSNDMSKINEESQLAPNNYEENKLINSYRLLALKKLIQNNAYIEKSEEDNFRELINNIEILYEKKPSIFENLGFKSIIDLLKTLK